MLTHPILEVNSVCKQFWGIQALNHAHFELYRGEVHALVGENGAGKSTLIKILSGLYTKDDGTIFFDGNEVQIRNPEDARTLGIAVIYQDFDLAPNLSVADNLLLGREPTRLLCFVNRTEHRKLATECLHHVGLHVNIDTLVEDLTVAERQLVAIAKSISLNARVLIMDEPTSALATNEIDHLLALITELKRQGTSIIYISHKLDEVFQISDRITVFRDGTYIGTKRVHKTYPQEIVSMMVGRTLEDYFSKVSHVQQQILLEVKGLHKSGVFHDINFFLRKGEILGIYGLKGAGRSEMTRSLFGLDAKEHGEFLLKGIPIEVNSAEEAIKHGMGLVPEDRKTQGLISNMNVRENMSIATIDTMSLKSFINKKLEQRIAEEYMNRLRIRTTGIEQMILGLSGGNQQKVILARWLISNPQVLILDEPTVGIDVGAKTEIYKMMNELTSQGIGIILISSELPEILGMSDRILVMHAGTIVGEFLQHEATEEKLIQCIHENDADLNEHVTTSDHNQKPLII